MGKAKELEFHEAANIFPLDDANIPSLADNIRERGLECPIELCGGKILDGRRRYRACRQAGIEPEYVEVDPDDPIAYVLSLNLHRRHLDESARGMVAGRAAKLKRGRPQQNGPIGPLSIDRAAKSLNVGARTVKRAKTVLERGSAELIKAVDDGDVAVSAAAKIAKLPKKEQTKAVRGGKKAVQQAAKQATAGAKIAGGNGRAKPKSFNAFFNACKELSERFDSIEAQYGSLAKMLDSPSWKPFRGSMIELVADYKKLFTRYDKEAKGYAAKHKI